MERVLRKPDVTPPPDPRGYAYGLPPALLQRTAFRLGMAALVYAATYTLAYGSNRVLELTRPDSGWGPVDLGDLLSVTFILLAVGVFFLTRKRDLNPARLLNLGLVFEVVGALGIEIGIILHPEGPPGDIAGISWVCVWIVIFPLIVPATPGKTLIAALAAASAGSFWYLLGLALGGSSVSTNVVVNYLFTPYICVGIAYVGFLIVYQLRTDASRAEEMGSYRLVEKLGVGGMGEVWRAEHRMLARPAAIKLIRPETLGARDERGKRELLTRFDREAQATAGLTSQNTIQLYDFGITGDGVFYYVMELLHGMDFSSMMERFGPPPPERTAFFLRQMCESLAEAHHHGLIHRDIKPANVFVCRLGLKYDVAKILDFGLVKSSGDIDETQVTMPQVTAGTPAFMAPEQVTGEGEVDHRTDIYALGCLVYWLLTGSLVFEGRDSMQVAFAHVHTQPEAPSRRTELEISPALERLVLECLEKAPGKRPQSAGEILERLDRESLDGHWDQERAADWWRTHLPELAHPDLPGERRGG